MKRLLFILIGLFICSGILAQVPQKISYQAVVRNSAGELIRNQPVGVRISILQGTIDGTEVYKEIFNPNPQTNANGLVTFLVGSGIVISGTFSNIDWSDGPYFLKNEVDPTGGTTYSIIGTTQLMSVPYALHAKTAETFTGGVGKVLNPATGKTWMDRNLGALRVALSSNDADAYGDLYQWGRAGDGHQYRTSSTTTTLSSSDTPGHGYFITTSSSPYDWRSPQNTNLWQGVNGVNNPCPPGYRLPTDAELNAERASWGSNNSAGAFASPLKLPVAGYRFYSNGSLGNVGSNGYYWSSTVDGFSSRTLGFSSHGAYMASYSRADGASVRCIKDD